MGVWAGARGDVHSWLLGGIVCLDEWRRWRRFGARCPCAVQALLPLIACRPELVESCAVGRRLGREDEWIWLRAAALIASADNRPVEGEVSCVFCKDRFGVASSGLGLLILLLLSLSLSLSSSSSLLPISRGTTSSRHNWTIKFGLVHMPRLATHTSPTQGRGEISTTYLR